MTETSNRTIVCCVLFVDIVEYSKKSVTEQLSLKQRFNAMLVDALKHVAVGDRIVLDTGDGAAVSFLGNPEDSLFAAMRLRDALQAEEPAPLLGRIGLNLGPVRLIKDINGQLNIIGDGINVAQRVMSFAEPGYILVSRSYYEVLARLSDDYERLFQYGGTHTDKHVREHSVYAIGPSSPATERTEAGAGADAGGAPPLAVPVAGGRSRWNNKRVAGVAVAVAVVLAGGALALRLGGGKETTQAPVSIEAQPAAAKEAAPGPAKAAADAAPPPAAARPSVAKITVTLAIAPWGEVYVDGQVHGVSPPLKVFSVPAGKHTIEIRNTTFPAHVIHIDGKAGEKVRVEHKF
ncbi:MAG TPA: hypothetical protein DHV21_09050 [Curvibacter sp.]|nr:hypothetical protein [Curvibacter sp.]